MAAGGGTKATLAALVANSGIAVAKFFAFAVTGSASMLAEAIHSVADTSNQGLLLLGIRRARRAPSATHPFGYGRERYFWSFVVTIVLFTLGSLFSLFEGWEKIRHPHEVSSLGWAIGVLALGIVLESGSLLIAVREADRERGSASWWTFIRRSKTPELPVVLLEDIGALLGLVMAMIGVSLAAATGEPTFDALGSLSIGILLGVIAVVLAIEMRSLLLGEAASASDIAAIRRAMEADPDLVELLSLRTQHLGPEELLVVAKVKLLASLSFDEVVRAIDRIETMVRATTPSASAMYIEPDTSGPPHPGRAPRDQAPADRAGTDPV